jgi:predicted phosphodiesterase|tara:strand:+ start:238 stop:996 length:759 start_codon:yes stop_codon:yes gene_type:complete
MNLLVIGDPHAHPDYSNIRFSALGKFIAKEKPEVIVCIGDMADMPSLSSYDKGTKGFEGRRYRKDVASVIDAQEKLFAPIKKIRGYKPQLHMCLGNHEDRITRAINSSPELDGAIGIEDLKYKEFGWKVTPFKRCVTIKGITFSHYFTSGIAGRPISSVHIGYALVTKLHCSAVQGHSHLYNHAEQTKPDGQKVFGLSAGCFSHPNYTETWCQDTEYQWWRGVIMLEGLDGEGYYNSIRAITQRSLQKKPPK